jgi:hypothetical protein
MLANDERLNALTAALLGAAIEVHRALGPGLLESIYLACFQFELSEQRLRFEAQKPAPVVYKSIRLGAMHRINVPRLTDGVRRLLNPKREGAEKTEKAGSHGGTEQRRHNP